MGEGPKVGANGSTVGLGVSGVASVFSGVGDDGGLLGVGVGSITGGM